MHRFFVPPEQCHGTEIELPEGEAHHAVKVLRLREGDRALVLNGQGEEILCTATSASRQGVRLRVTQRNPAKPPACRLTLFQAVVKPKAMDFILQKATELGVARIVPVLSERSVSDLPGEAAAHKAVRWRSAAVEAAKQCGTPWLPAVEAPTPVSAVLAHSERFDLQFVASLQREARHPREYFAAAPAWRHLGIWVGPEGDFTPAEMNAIRGAGALPITLGPLVLRSETAALYCLSVLSYEAQARPPAGPA